MIVRVPPLTHNRELMEQRPAESATAATPKVAVPKISAHEAEALLRSGLGMAADMLGAAFPTMCRPAADSLISTLDSEAGAATVRRTLSGKTAEFRDALVRNLQRRQDEALGRIIERPRAANLKNISADNLTLVEADDWVSHPAIDRVAGKIRGQLETILRDVHLLVGFIAGREGLRNPDDPFSPEVFIHALVGAGVDLGLHAEDLNPLAGAFEKPMTEELQRIYTAVLERLRTRGLDAKAIRRELAARQASAHRGSHAAAAAAAAAKKDGESAAWTDTLGLPTEAIAPITQGPVSGAGGSAGPAPAGGIQISMNAAAALGNLMARLQANAHGEALPRGMASPGIAPARLLNAVQELQHLGLQGLAGAAISTPEGQGGVWREHLIEKSSRTVDKLTIEIVGMLFDHVLQDKQVPVEIKALLSRMQFPVLKVALMDADFFVTSTHPARRLIDRIASTSIGWEPYGDENAKYRAEVERIVRTVLERFDKDSSIFERLLAEFDLYVGETSTHDNDPVSRAKRALEEAEKREILVINTTIQVRRAFEKVHLEPYLRDFLVGPWVQALVTAIMRDDETPGFSKDFRKVIHDLVWSVQPKVSAEERKRLVALIPPTMRILRDGLTSIRMPEHDQNQFFHQLMQSHAMAVRPVDQATYIKHSLATSELRSRIDEMRITGAFPITTVAGGIKVSEGALMRAAEQHSVQMMIPVAPTDVGPLDRDEEAALDEKISTWQRGTWFDLWNGTDFIRARLRWISPLRTLFMFSCAQESQARVLAPDVLKSYLKRGFLKPLEHDPLMKRAVDGVVGDFEKTPKRAEQLAERFEA